MVNYTSAHQNPGYHTEEIRRARVISLDLSIGDYAHFQEVIIEAACRRQSKRICFANAHMIVEARRNHKIAQAVNDSAWVAVDGVPLIWALRGLHHIEQERIAGMDLMPSLLQRAAEENLSVFFYGSTPEVLEQTAKKCRQQFPGLIIAGTESPPFRSLTPQEEQESADRISTSGAGLVFVALGCPKQELWMARMQGRIPAVMLGIGAALPLLAGSISRAPLWVRTAGMEWVYRLGQEPRRLLKRYLTVNSRYIWYLAAQVLQSAQKKQSF
ncbi:WecB/TagA/CpsF family glycosyltransferase [Larkinella ripae]